MGAGFPCKAEGLGRGPLLASQNDFLEFLGEKTYNLVRDARAMGALKKSRITRMKSGD